MDTSTNSDRDKQNKPNAISSQQDNNNISDKTSTSSDLSKDLIQFQIKTDNASYEVFGSSNCIEFLKKLTQEVESTKKLNDYLKAQLTQLQSQHDSEIQEIKKRTVADSEQELVYLRNKVELLQKFGIRETIAAFITYISDIYNNVLDSTDLEHLKNEVQQYTRIYINNLKANGLTIHLHSRGSKISPENTDPIDITNCPTEDPELDGVVKSCDQFGCKFDEIYRQNDIREHLNVYAYEKPTSSQTNEIIGPAKEDTLETAKSTTESTTNPIDSSSTKDSNSKMFEIWRECLEKRPYEESYNLLTSNGVLISSITKFGELKHLHYEDVHSIVIRKELRQQKYEEILKILRKKHRTDIIIVCSHINGTFNFEEGYLYSLDQIR